MDKGLQAIHPFPRSLAYDRLYVHSTVSYCSPNSIGISSHPRYVLFACKACWTTHVNWSDSRWSLLRCWRGSCYPP